MRPCTPWEAKMRAENIWQCDRGMLINALMDLETSPVIDRAKIRAANDKAG